MAAEIQKLPDEQLAQRSQAGDWGSFDELVRRYEVRIYRFTLSCCGHEADARELTQETFVSAYQHLRKYDPALSFTTWLFTIARRKCIDRSRRPRRDHVSEIPELPDADDPTVLIGQREAAEDLWRTARRVLSPTQFQTLWLHYAEDLSVREVAQVMRRLQPHVKVLLFRARRVLAKELEPPGTGDPSRSYERSADRVPRHDARFQSRVPNLKPGMKPKPISRSPLEAELRQTRSTAPPPSDLHRSILSAVRAAATPARPQPALFWGRWGGAAVVAGLLALCVWWGFVRPPMNAPPPENPGLALQGTPNISEQASLAMVAPLSQELEFLSQDFSNAVNFLAASVP